MRPTGAFFVKIKFLRCGRAIGPKLRACHRIFAAGIPRSRGPKRAGSRGCIMAGSFAGRATDRGRFSVRDTCIACPGNAGQFDPLARCRLDSSSNRHQATEVGFLATPSKPCGLQPTGRVSLPLLPIQREYPGRLGPRVPGPTCRRVHLVQRAGLGRCRISNRRSRALRYVAGHASQVLRPCFAGTRGGR